MSNSLHPTEGIRLLLDRESISADTTQAVYRAAIYTVDEVFAYRIEMAMDGTAELAAEDKAAIENDEQSLSKIARSTARAAKRKAEEDLPPWPVRVLRWRGPGRG